MRHIKNREFLTEIDLQEPDYSFDVLGLWRDENGFYLGTDSGCSCPSPWESHTEEDLTGPLTLDQTIEEAVSLWRNAGKYGDMDHFIETATKSFMSDVDTRWIVTEPYDLLTSKLPTGAFLTDADGVEWIHAGYNEYVRKDGVGDTVDGYDLIFPLEVHDA